MFGLWALALSVAFAQDPPPQQQPPAQEPPAEEEKPPPNHPKLVLGWGSWGLTGNRTTFNRYASMNRGFFIRELSYGIHEASPANFGRFAFRGWPSEDNVVETQVIFGPRAAYFSGSLQRHQFYRPSIFVIGESSRRSLDAALRYPLNTRTNIVLDVSDGQMDKIREAPATPIHTRVDRITGQVATEIGRGQANLSFTNRRYFDRMDLRPDLEAQTMRGGLLLPIGSLNLEGSYAFTKFDQSGFRQSELRNAALDGELPFGPNFSLQFGLQNSKYELPETVNAYVRERATSWAKVVGHFGGMNGQLGWKHTETERVRADHSFVDVPKFNTFDAKLSGRFGSGPRWTLKGKWENLDGDAVMLTNDPNRLYWDDKADFQLHLGHGGDLWSAYASFSHRFFQNEAREIDIRSNNFVAGGSYQLRPQIELFGEMMFDSANTQFTEIGGLVGLDSFFPSSQLFTVGANWIVDPATTLSLSYSDLKTDNDNPNFDPEGNVSFRFFTANLQHQTKSGNRFGLLVAPGKYSDRVIRQMGFNSTVVLLTAEWRY